VELQAFHHLPAQDAADIIRQVEDAECLFEVIVAEGEDTGVLGFALASVYPGPGIAPGLYLKELYVRDSARSLGVGKVLMQSLAKLALSRGYERIDWITTRENLGAQRFYERLGATLNLEKVFYRLDGDALQDLADQ
jgi:GNAT superfamily N-acetyltransferase